MCMSKPRFAVSKKCSGDWHFLPIWKFISTSDLSPMAMESDPPGSTTEILDGNLVEVICPPMSTGDQHELAFLVGVVAVAGALCLLSLVALCHCLRHALSPAEKPVGYILTGVADDEVEMAEMRSFPLPRSGQVPRVRTPPSPSPSPVKFVSPRAPAAQQRPERSVESLLVTQLLPGRQGRMSATGAATAHRTRSLPVLPTQSFLINDSSRLLQHDGVEGTYTIDVEGTYTIDVNNDAIRDSNAVSAETIVATSRSASLEGALSAAMSEALTRTTVSIHEPSISMQNEPSDLPQTTAAEQAPKQLPSRRRGPRKRYPRTPLPKAALHALSTNHYHQRPVPPHGGSDTERKSAYAPSDTDDTQLGGGGRLRHRSQLVLVSRRALERLLRRPLSASDLRDAADDVTLHMSGLAPLEEPAAGAAGAAAPGAVAGEFVRTASPDWDHSGERQPLAATPSLTVAPNGDQWV